VEGNSDNSTPKSQTGKTFAEANNVKFTFNIFCFCLRFSVETYKHHQLRSFFSLNLLQGQ